MSSTRRFKAKVAQSGGKCFVPIPFDPNEVWGEKQRHHITGTIDDHAIRGELGADGAAYFLNLGPAWRRDSGIEAGATVTVILSPEGPQQDNVAADIAAALGAEPSAQAFFESLPTFYRKNYMRWIDSAKRPETRAARIAEMVALLKAGKRQR
jgi:hypothetical protein